MGVGCALARSRSRLASPSTEGVAYGVIREMPRALITTSFPATTEVARKLGLSASRIQHVAALMDSNNDHTRSGKSVRVLKQASKRNGAKTAKANRAKR
jgi:hypothetical protein